MLASILTLTILPLAALATPFPLARVDSHTSSVTEASFVLVGDSTTNNGTTPNSGGWSRGFCASLEEGTGCSNRAANGRTTGTIVSDGYWAAAMDDVDTEVAKGKTVFVTLQFGHNDMKISPPSSMATNLTVMIHEARARGAVPVLLTPLTRRGFTNGTEEVADTLGPWAQATIEVAANTSAPLVDLHAASLHYVEAIGQNASQLLNRLPEDRTHLNLAGQMLFGRMVADLFQLTALNHPSVRQTVFAPVYPDNSTSACCYLAA